MLSDDQTIIGASWKLRYLPVPDTRGGVVER